MPPENLLWYDHPAASYPDGLPIGTGKVAAMVLGRTEIDDLHLNHEWLWNDRYRYRDTEPVHGALGEIRKLLLDGRYEEATLKANQAMLAGGGWQKAVPPRRICAYQPMGALRIKDSPGPTALYRRSLDLTTGLAEITYKVDKTHCARRFFASLKRDLLLGRCTSDAPRELRFSLWRTVQEGVSIAVTASDSVVRLDGILVGGLRFRIEAHVAASGGTCRVEGNELIASGTDILVAIAQTVALDNDPAELDIGARAAAALTVSWDDLTKESAAVYAPLYGAVTLEAGTADPGMPTDVRVERARAGNGDSGLAVLAFNYGRYLLIASAANAELPPNLQGKWNDLTSPPWHSDYTMDINLQINHWHAEASGLGSLTRPMFRYLDRCMPHARKAAKDLYNCDGIFLPLDLDAWGRCTPENWGWAVWVGAASWMVFHYWQHYLYSGDAAFLAEQAYPFASEVARFWESYCTTDRGGRTVIVPSQSPENSFFEGTGEKFMVSLCVSSACDVSLSTEALRIAAEMADKLSIDAEKAARWRGLAEKIGEPQVGRDETILEWGVEVPEVERNHRHFSHLVGLFPGSTITPLTPELYSAAKKSLARRLSDNRPRSGCFGAWTACFYARMGEAEECWRSLYQTISTEMSEALLTSFAKGKFAIDGTFGAAAAVCVMLLDYQKEVLRPLPALPAQWPEGTIDGLRAPGGFVLRIQWTQGKLNYLRIISTLGLACRLALPPGSWRITDGSGRSVAAVKYGDVVSLPTVAGDSYTVRHGS